MNLYSLDYLNKIKKQKIVNLIVLISIILLFLGLETLIIIFNSMLAYGDNRQTLLKVLLIITAIIFVPIISFYFSLKYLRVSHYYNFLINILSCKKSIFPITVLEVNKNVITKDKVDCYVLSCLTWSDLNNDYVKQNVYIDAEFLNLQFVKNEILNVKISSNFLIEFEELNNEAQ